MIGLAWIGLSVHPSCVILRHLPDSIPSDLPDKRRWKWFIVGELNRIFASLIVPEFFSEGFDRRAGRHEVEVCLVCRIREKYTPLLQDWLTSLQSLRCMWSYVLQNRSDLEQVTPGLLRSGFNVLADCPWFGRRHAAPLYCPQGLHQAATVNSFVLSQSYRSLNSLRISGGEPGVIRTSRPPFAIRECALSAIVQHKLQRYC